MKLKDFKMPKLKLKFKKMRINIPEEIENIDYSKEVKKNQKKRTKPYEDKTNYKTVKEFFFKTVKENPGNPCILEKPGHKEDYKVTTYQEFYDDVVGLGTALIEVLKLKDKSVMIIGETQYDWYVSYMAMLCGVGLVVPTDKELPVNEIENIANRSKVSAIIYSPKKEDDIEKVKSSLPNVEYYIEMKSDDGLSKDEVGIKNLIKLGKAIVNGGNKKFEKIKVNPDEFRILFWTSGTTSNSKGVMLSNRNLAENINAVSAYVKVYPTDRFFSVLPLHHCYESTIGFLLPMACGSSIAICEGLRYVAQNMQEAKPTTMLAVPLLIESLYKKINEKIVKNKKDKLVNSMMQFTNALKSVGIDVKRKVFKEIYDNLGGEIRIIVSAAAPIDKKVGEWVQDLGIKFLQGYGLTETAPIAALTPDYEPSVGSVGRAIVQADIKVKDPNENGEGEILIKSPTLMLGYYEMPEETAKVIDKDGYFNSGDIGYIDEKGFIYLTGRSKNVIVTQNGKNVYPEEIEMLLEKVDEIKEVFVYGKAPEANSKKDDKELIITAKVVPNYDKIKEIHDIDKDDEDKVYDIIWNKIKEVNKKLTSYKAIKSLEIKEGEFEKTSTMKIKRYKEINKDKDGKKGK